MKHLRNFKLFDIVRPNNSNTPYVVLGFFKDTNFIKYVMSQEFYIKYGDDPIHRIEMGNREFDWTYVGTHEDTIKERNHPNYKVILKVKQMIREREEQGYAF